MLKTKDHKQFTMAINRTLAICIIVVTFLVIAGVFLPIVLLHSLPVSTFPKEDLCITNVQFEEDYLNITVKNSVTQAKIVSEVTIRDLIKTEYSFSINRTSTPLTVAVHESISSGEEISFRIIFKWTSGRSYRIELETVDTKDWSPATIYNAFAPY